MNRQTDRQTEPAYRYRFERLCGLGKFASAKSGGQIASTAKQEELESFTASQNLLKALSLNQDKAIDNFRIQRLMGILPLAGKATARSIPSEGERSMFSCVRYQFFLDADFEISQACCGVMKKAPTKAYERKTGRHGMTAMMATESRLRTQQWLKNGCNAFDAKKPISNPMAFWTEQDVLLYILENNLTICSVYGDIVKDAGDGVEGQLDLEDIYGKELFDLGRPLLKTTGCNRTG